MMCDTIKIHDKKTGKTLEMKLWPIDANSLKRRAGRMLSKKEIMTGYCILSDTITIHNYNNTGKSLEMKWGGTEIGEWDTPTRFLGQLKKREYKVCDRE